LLKHVPALQLLSHRIVWSFLFLLAFMLVTRQWKPFRAAIANRRVLLIYFIAALLIGVNWLTYVWAVNAGYIVETSLGYFINPLLNVLLGVVFLRERLRPFQWVPVVMAACGVIYLTVAYGQLPWIALTLAFTTFVLFQFFNAFNARAEHGSAFNANFFRNGKLWLALAGVLALQVMAVHWPPAQAIFGTVDLRLEDWLLAAAAASSVLLLDEARKLLLELLRVARGKTH
jgi:EamA domain-containing membrane protein RarD